MRPYIVCHMLTSINGKISGAYMSSEYTEAGSCAYETTNDHYHSQAWLCGRITMEENFTHYQKPDLHPEKILYANDVLRKDFVAEKHADMYIVSADPAGKVGWKENYVDYAERPRAHIIEVLTDQVSNAYLNFLRAKNISYIFAGETMIDCKKAAEKLATLFQIKTLMVSGGGFINWSFLQEKIVDELSIVVAPVTDGDRTTNTIFERGDKLPMLDPIGFKLKSVDIIAEDTLWLRYTVQN